MRIKVFRFLLVAWMLLSVSASACAEEYQLANGNIIQGDVSSLNADGVVFRPEGGSFSERIHWATLSQDSLKRLAESSAEAKKFAELYIEIPLDEIVEPEPIVIHDVPRVARVENPTWLGAFATPFGIFLALVIAGASGYAGFEAARFRQQPRVVGAIASVLLPVIGPIIFLALPTGQRGHADAEEAYDEPAGEPEPGPAAGSGAPPPPGSAGSLSLAGAGAPAAAAGKATEKTYKRGETTFNRKFFESTFAGFFRIVPGDAEKDMVLAVRSGRNEVVGKRITRISSNELHLQQLSGTEKSVAFSEMQEVQVRHKDAKK